MGVAILKQGLTKGPLSHDPEWFNKDDNYATAVQQALDLQLDVVLTLTIPLALTLALDLQLDVVPCNLTLTLTLTLTPTLTLTLGARSTAGRGHVRSPARQAGLPFPGP